MPLHELFAGDMNATYWWYAAVPNERRGRLHILRVPCHYINAQRLHAPAYMRPDQRETWQESRRNAGPYVPARISAENQYYSRNCEERQTSRLWLYEPEPGRTRNVGICPMCRHFANTHANEIAQAMFGSANRRTANSMSQLYPTTTAEEWTTQAQRHIYGG